MKPKLRFKGFDGEWGKAPLGTIASFSKGKGYSKSDIKSEGTPILLYGQLYTNYKAEISEIYTYADIIEGAVISKGGEVVIPASGETAEDIAIASSIKNSGIIIGGDLNVLSLDKSEFDSCFAALSISNSPTHMELSGYAQGKTIVHLHSGEIKKANISYPSKEEQSAIGGYFQKLDGQITATEARIEGLRKVKAASLQAMFPQEGETKPRLRFKGFSDDWKIDVVKNICDTSNGKSNTQDQVEDGSFPFFIRSEKIVRSNRYLYDCEAVITVGDGQIGKIFHYINGKFDLHQRCYFMSNFREIDGKFFYYYFSNSFYDRVIRMSAKATVDSVRLEMITNMPIAYPVDNFEQQKIADYFANLDRQISLEEQRLEKLRQIKAACLDNMFV